jgi:hypothetical protein
MFVLHVCMCACLQSSEHVDNLQHGCCTAGLNHPAGKASGATSSQGGSSQGVSAPAQGQHGHVHAPAGRVLTWQERCALSVLLSKHVEPR